MDIEAKRNSGRDRQAKVEPRTSTALDVTGNTCASVYDLRQSGNQWNNWSRVYQRRCFARPHPRFMPGALLSFPLFAHFTYPAPSLPLPDAQLTFDLTDLPLPVHLLFPTQCPFQHKPTFTSISIPIIFYLLFSIQCPLQHKPCHTSYISVSHLPPSLFFHSASFPTHDFQLISSVPILYNLFFSILLPSQHFFFHKYHLSVHHFPPYLFHPTHAFPHHIREHPLPPSIFHLASLSTHAFPHIPSQ